MKRSGDKYRLNGKSQYKFKREDGVRYIRSKKKFLVQVQTKSNVIKSLGFYNSKSEADEAYNNYNHD